MSHASTFKSFNAATVNAILTLSRDTTDAYVNAAGVMVWCPVVGVVQLLTKVLRSLCARERVGSNLPTVCNV